MSRIKRNSSKKIIDEHPIKPPSTDKKDENDNNLCDIHQ
jgi:hypothetical protein